MKFLTKESILNAKDLNITKVEIPEWDGYVFIRAMTGKERDEISKIWAGKETTEEKTSLVQEIMLQLTLCDEQGKSLFNRDNIKELQDKNGEVLTRLFLTAQDISGLSKKKVEEMEKNL